MVYRFLNKKDGQIAFLSLDGVDFEVYEPNPFNKKWYSHKFNRAGLRYEIGICINTGHICWIGGGIRAGQCNDLQLAERSFVTRLLPNERVVADKIYTSNKTFIGPPKRGHHKHGKLLKKIMARHENINKRFKDYKLVKKRWRHDWRKHNLTILAIGQIVQFRILTGEPMADVSLV